MNPTPYPFEDFLRAKQALRCALIEHPEPFALLTGEVSGQTAPSFQVARASAMVVPDDPRVPLRP